MEDKKLIFKPDSYPFFKFTPAAYSNGEITLADPYAQGIFINICCLYWPRAGKLNIDFCKRQMPFMREIDIQSLTDLNVIKVDEKGFISINFLDEQMAECAKFSDTQSLNGQGGGRPLKSGKKPKNNRSVNQNKPIANPNETQNKTNQNPEKSNKNETREDKSERITTVGSSNSHSEASNGLPNADSLTGLWARLSAKVNLNAADVQAYEKKACEIIAQIEADTDRKEIWNWIGEMMTDRPDLFTDGEEIVCVLEVAFQDYRAGGPKP